MKAVAVPAGIRGARTLASAYADIRLRKLGLLPALKQRTLHGSGKRTWTDGEFDAAITLKLRGRSLTEIAREIGRPRTSIAEKLWGMV